MNSIVDGMKPENKKFIKIGIVSLCIVIIPIIMSLFLFDIPMNIKDIMLLLFGIIFIEAFVLYGYLYGEKYKLEVTTSQIKLRTLFSKIEINISDIKSYSYKRYRKTVFYQFYLITEKKKYLINTRFRDEFIEILKINNINLK